MQRSGKWKRIRKLAYERDARAGAVCHICGQPIDYHLPPGQSPYSYEPDHIVPVSLDNSKELDLCNILASHRHCNRARGNGTSGENNVGQQSRIW